MLATVFPLVSFLLFFMPGPSIWLGVKRGVVKGALSTFIVSIVMGLFGGLQFMGIYLLISMPIVVITVILIKEKKENWKIIGINILALVIMAIIFLINLTFILKIDIVREVSLSIDKMAQEVITIIENAGISKFVGNKDNILQMADLVKMSLPGTLVVSGISLVVLSYIYALNMLKKDNYKLEHRLRFIDLRLDIKTIIPLAILGLILGVAYLLKWKYFDILFVNALSIVGFLFMMAGIFTIDYFFINRMPKPLRFIIPILVIILFGGSYFYMIVGLVDMFVNFRKRFKRMENEKI